MKLFLKVSVMAMTSVRNSFPPLLAFLIFVCLLLSSFASSDIVSSGKSLKPGYGSPTPGLGREKRDIIPFVESVPNLKVFDHRADFHSANGTSNENSKYVAENFIVHDSISVKGTVFPPPDLSNVSLCYELQAKLGKSIAAFSQCAVMKARPINMCCHCVIPFNDTIHAYELLMEASENNTKCKDVFFGKDKLEIIDAMYASVVNLWNQGNCYTCYSSKNNTWDLSVESDETRRFFLALHEVEGCFKNITSNQMMKDISNDTCSRCQSLYKDLRTAFSDVLESLHSNDGVCADVTDAMNLTQYLWNNQLKCKLFNTDVSYGVIVSTICLCALPIMYYAATKILSNVETIHLVHPKRKFPFWHDTHEQM